MYAAVMWWPRFHLTMAEHEASASANRLRGIGLWSGRSLDVVHAQILAQLMETDKMIPMIAFGMPFKEEIL
jgi:hypothetical protein